MDLDTDVAAAWAQAILSALAIVVSALLAIWLPARERKITRLRQEMDAGRRLLWAVTAVVSQWVILKPELETRQLDLAAVKAQAQRISKIADDMGAVQIVDVPVPMIEHLWRIQILVAYFASAWDTLRDPEFDGKSALAEASEFAEMAKKTVRDLAAIKIGGRTVGNPNPTGEIFQ